MGLHRAAGAEEAQPLQLVVGGVVADRAAVPDVTAEQHGDLAERAGDVVVVADPRDRVAGQRRTERFLHGEGIGHCLERVGVVREEVDDRHLGDGDHALEDGVLEHPGRDHAVVPLQDAGDVLDRLAGVEPDFFAACVDGVTAELHHRHLGRVPGTSRRFLEDQCDTRSGQGPAERVGRDGREVEHDPHLVGGQVGDLEDVAHGHDSAPARTSAINATASSISASVTVSGGAKRSAVGVTALVINPRLISSR